MTEIVRDAMSRAARNLNSAGVPDAKTDARFLMAFALGRSTSIYAVDDEIPLCKTTRAKFEHAVELRLQRKPVSKIVGYRAFWKQRFHVDCNVLDPRPESEVLVEQALKIGPKRILDMGTGSGCLLLAILSECPHATGIGVDCSDTAIEVAALNAEALGLRGRAKFIVSSWFRGIKGKFDLIVSNPPYVSESEYAVLDPEITNWEPEVALKAGEFGLDAYTALADGAHAFLAPDGEFLLEIGRGREVDVQRIFERAGYRLRRAYNDLDKKIRALGFESKRIGDFVQISG